MTTSQSSIIFTLVVLFGISATSGSTYNPQLALDMLYYVKAVYCPTDSITFWNCGIPCNYNPQMIDVKGLFNSAHHAQAFTGYDKKNNRIVAAFRGTVDLKNEIQDARIKLVQYPNCDGCKVEAGFYTVFLDVQDLVLNSVQDLQNQYPQAQIVVTGHSLGAAMATLGAAELKIKFGQVDEFYSFGSPRLGNTNFVAWWNSNFDSAYRITRKGDPFVTLPFRKMKYHHVKGEVFYNFAGTQYKVCDDANGVEDKTCALSMKGSNGVDHYWYLGQYILCG